MAFNISQFISQIDRGNLARKSLFDCIISRPNSDNDENLTFRINHVILPGRNIRTVEHSDYGVQYHRAYISSFEPVYISVILSDDLREKEFFESWQDEVIGNYRTGNISQSMYDLGYYNDYIGTMEIRCYDETGNKSYTAKLQECYPIGINGLRYDWQDNEVQNLDVIMAYKFYTITE